MKRGQAAMEFLMTYGWAILAAIIAIGALAYFGVFSPGRYVGGTAQITAPFGLENHQVNTDGIQLELRNGLGERVEIQSVDITGCATNSTAFNMTTDTLFLTSVGCTLSSGDTFRGDITVTYRKIGSSLDRRATGRLTDRVI